MVEPTIYDAEDVFLAAKAEFEEWKDEFLANWYAPVLEMAIRKQAQVVVQMWDGIPDPVKEQLRVMVPEAVKDVEMMVAGGKNGNPV